LQVEERYGEGEEEAQCFEGGFNLPNAPKRLRDATLGVLRGKWQVSR